METVYVDANDPNFFGEYRVEVRQDQKDWIEKLRELREQITSGHMESDFQINGQWVRALCFDRHLYVPLLCLRDRDDRGKKTMVDEHTNEPLIKISPVPLNAGEQTFVRHIREYYNEHKDDVLAGKEVYLLRNNSRKGIGFFEANNFYPDFILWVNDGEKQRVTFVDPKGIRNLRGLDDPKIQLYKLLKTEIAPRLGDPGIVLDSFIISNTPYEEVDFWNIIEDNSAFKKNHIIFQTDGDYIGELFGMIFNL